ncbi:GNAT family N-acetyltransferase [Actinomadura rupiterrae]|uniref:GNAT family N-acetyltransferase n=1 Tax=Actinomadura rupiterrae TaxID=559627 RepID=UPI0020A48E2E|nr:GNAT family N-acetyltransferase [Actinomadura rupiterrae]MCP2338080.1 CelD/BcsL family acetyltransferase involved in cellulose biosynthesis [Actinomadura rupiterrae]
MAADPRPGTGLRLVAFDALKPAELDAWQRLRAADARYDSPYFHPGFAAAVHASGRPVTVAVASEGEQITGSDGQSTDIGQQGGGGGARSTGAGGRITGVFALQRDGAVARPVGWPGADFQGPITAAGHAFPVRSLVTGTSVRNLEFDHLLDGTPGFEPWTETRRPSPFLDVSGGLDGYLGRASRSGKDNMSQARRRIRKAERTLGPVTFEADIVDPVALDELIELKRGQYEATNARDYFADPSRRELLHLLLNTRSADFGGVLSVVRAGPHLLAAHFGLRSGGVLHWWFPVYDPAHAALAPGWILLRELVSAAPDLGVTRIDLGRGEDEYKRRAKTGETFVCQGAVLRGPVARAVRRVRNTAVGTARNTLRDTRLAPALRRARRAMETARQSGGGLR